MSSTKPSCSHCSCQVAVLPPKFSRKLKWILLSFPKRNILAVHLYKAESLALPDFSPHIPVLSWCKQPILKMSFHLWKWPLWISMAMREAMAKILQMTLSNGDLEQQWETGEIRNLRGASTRSRSTVEPPLQSKASVTRLRNFFAHFPQPHTSSSFPQILQEAISGRRCHGLWRKDKNQYFNRKPIWMYGEWEHHFKMFRNKENFLLSWGACRREWLKDPQDYPTTSGVPVLGCHISCQIRTRGICYEVSSMWLSSRLSSFKKKNK